MTGNVQRVGAGQATGDARARRAVACAAMVVAAVGAGTAGEAAAQPLLPAQEPVVVTGSPRAQRTLDAPFAITTVDAQALQDAGPMVNLSEALVRVPGLVANNRSNYAQDLQLSSRGFGARATFGVRGLRLYTDGIPATMPDGQGQVAHADLAGAQRVEVLRGPFSVLYGNSSGGVIAVFTAPVKANETEASVDAGSFGLRQARLGVAASLGQGLDLRASLAKFEIDGFRPQSAADRQLGNVRLGWQGGADTITVLVSDHNQSAQDPQGLNQAQFNTDPRQTAPQPVDYNTCKTIRQTQGGLNWRHVFGNAGALRESVVTAYAGSRGVTQFLSIPPASQTPNSAGGVVDFDRRYSGADARLLWQFGAADLVTGLSLETQRDQRRGFENFTGSGTAQLLGVWGRQRRNERNDADTREFYLQGQLPLSPDVALTGGLRHGTVKMRSADYYLANGDDSGTLSYRYTNPVLGLRWTLAPAWTVHASLARGFESPTLTELAYREGALRGFNTALVGQTSRQFELGSKWRGQGLSVEAAVFAANTENEIGVLSNLGGRAVFQNVGRTQRRGAELAMSAQLVPGLRLQVAASWLQAEYLDAFLTCTSAGCPSPTNPKVSVAAGNRIAGTTRASLWAEAAWRAGWLPGELALEWRAVSSTPANDVNTAFAPGYALANLRWSGTVALGARDALQLMARVDNLADRVYVGSVIVNDGNSRFFETGAPRNLLLSARWQHRW